MPTQILMPALSPTMEEGKLARWLVKEGDVVKSGKVIAEIETDKATMEVEAVDEGTVGRLLVPEGTEKVRVNTPIALLLGEGESAAALSSSPVGEVARSAGGGEAATSAALRSPPTPAPSPQGGGDQVRHSTSAHTNGHANGARVFASPLARRLAREAGIDLAALAGSGPHGRIIRRDIESAAKGGSGCGECAIAST